MSANKSSAQSDEDELVVVKRSGKTRRISEDEEKKYIQKTPEENDFSATTLRSSERLRTKSQRRHSVLPSRNKILDKILVETRQYETMSLQPKRLINDFVKGANRYVADRSEVFESDDSESSFIDDSEGMPPKKSESSNDKRKIINNRRNKMIKMKKNELESDDENDTFIRRVTRKKSRRLKSIQSSSDEGVEFEPNSDEESLYKGKMSKRNKSSSNLPASSSSEDGRGIKLQKNKRQSSNRFDSSDTDEQPNRKLPKRGKSAKKEKETVLLARLKAKRNMENNGQKNIQMNVGNSGHESVVQSQHDGDTSEEDNFSVINSTEDFLEDESDREFMVDDYCDADDNVSEFCEHFHNIEDNTGNKMLKLTEKKSNNFHRICIPTESDDSADESILDSIVLNMYKAIREGDVKRSESVLKTNPSLVHDVGPKRRSLLHVAVISGSAEITKLLLRENADKLAKDAYSLQPISYGILTGHLDCLKLLLENTDLHELNKLYEDNLNFNLLHFVVYGKNRFPDLNCEMAGDGDLLHCIKILIEHDGDLLLKLMSRKDDQNFTPLVAAIIVGHLQCAEFLLYNGSSVDDIEGTNGGNFLHLVLQSSLEMKEASLDMLLKTSLKYKINFADNSGFTPLMYAAQNGEHDCVRILLKAGASLLCKDHHGTTSLHLAATSGDTETVQLLLQYGHQVDCLDASGWPPLLYANFAAQESCVLSLIEPNPKQIFVLGDLLRKNTSEAGKERNFKVVRDVLLALANQDAYYRVFNDFIRRNPDVLDEYDRGLLRKTWKALLDYDNKLKWFQKKLESLRKNREGISLRVDRKALFESAMKVLNSYSGTRLRNSHLRVTFANEEGMCTGPKREFFVNICKDIVDSRHQIFHLTDNNQYSFLPNSYLAEKAKSEGESIKEVCFRQGNKATSGGHEYTSDITRVANGYQGSVSSSTRIAGQSSGSQGIREGLVAGQSSGSRGVSEDLGLSNDQSCTMATTVETEQNATQVPSSPWSEYMDESEDEIIGQLDISDIEDKMKEDKKKFGRLIDQRLKKNISQIKFLGKIIGTAICEGFFINLNLCKPIVKQILGVKLNHPDDLSSFDFELHKSLETFVLESDDVEDLMLPCTLDVVNPWNGRLTTLTLFSKEKNEEFLNDQNKVEYVNLVSQYKLTDLMKNEMDSLCQGLFEVIPAPLFTLFTADEFSLLINGIGKIDVEDWRKNSLYTPCNAANSFHEIKWFWEIVKGLKEEEKALLLKFSTGSPCLPAGGFAQLQGLGGKTMFHIAMKSDYNKIPTASTCFNLLKLPKYDSKKDLKEKLLIAIRHGTEGFTFS